MVHLCLTDENCSLRQLMREHSYEILLTPPPLTLNTPVTKYGPVIGANKELANCGDFVKIHDGVSKICHLQRSLRSFILFLSSHAV